MPKPRPQRRRSRTALRLGRERAHYLARRLGIALHDRRLAAGLTQREVAERTSLSQQEVSHLELGRGRGTSFLTWAEVGAAVGLQLAGFFEQAPGADLPRDIQHLRGQNLIITTARPGGWAGTPESVVEGDGSRPRSIDVLLTREVRQEAAVVEVWDLLLDGGAAMRGLEAKVLATRERLGPGWRVEGLLVVRGTARNRALVRDLAPLFAARYPARSGQWLRALADPLVPMPSAGGLAWTDVAGTRTIAARW